MADDVRVVDRPTGYDTLKLSWLDSQDQARRTIALGTSIDPASLNRTGSDARTWQDSLEDTGSALSDMCAHFRGHGTTRDITDAGDLFLLLLLSVCSTSAVSDPWLAGRRAAIRLMATDWDPAVEAAIQQDVLVSLRENPAKSLRDISGLELDRLSAIFGVSRTAYYDWMSGSTPRGERRDHLLEVLSLVEEASKRLGDPAGTSTWLLTPVSSRGERPIDFLAVRNYTTFRGLLLRIPTEREVIRPFLHPSRVRRELTRQEFKERIERLSPRPRSEDTQGND